MYFVHHAVNDQSGKKLNIMVGKLSSANANIKGKTPLPLTFMGIKVDCPPYILLPLICLAYCTLIFLSAPSTHVIKAKITTTSRTKTIKSQPPALVKSPVSAMFTKTSRIACPADAMIPIKINMDMPFETPYSVILSPIHMVSMLPATKIIVTMMNNTHVGTVNCAPNIALSNRLSLLKASRIPTALTTARPSVTYLVITAILCFPSSPSLESLSRAGIATVNNCIMMDALI